MSAAFQERTMTAQDWEETSTFGAHTEWLKIVLCQIFPPSFVELYFLVIITYSLCNFVQLKEWNKKTK